MLLDYALGQGSIVLRVKVRSSLGPFQGLTGLSSASAGLRVAVAADNEAITTAYTQAGSTIESIATLGTYAAPTATKCRFREFDPTNHPGVYELQVADARFAVGSAKSALITLSGVAGMAECDVLIPLRAVNPYDGTAFGLSRLDVLVSSRSTYAGGDTSGTTALLARLTAARAGYLDALNTGVVMAAAGFDNVIVESGLNARQALAIQAAMLGGTISGATSIGGTCTISGAGVGTARVVMTGDASGNRSGILLTPPA